MSLRHIKQALIASAITAQLLTPIFANSDQDKLNVLMIVIDDLRPELNCYGVEDIYSPNIDRLAQKGMLFEHAYAQYPVCNPSRASFLSGLRPDEVGITSNKMPLRRVQPDLVTLPQLFRENGYYTAGLGKIYHLSIDEADERGNKVLFKDPQSWDYFFDALGNTTSIGKKGEGRNLTNGKVPWAKWKATEGGDEDQPDGQIAAEAIRILEEQHDKPFFIGYGIHKPHDPFVAPNTYFELYPKGSTQLAEQPEDRSTPPKFAVPSERAFAEFTDKERSEFKRAYHACVSFADAQVGKILDTMDRLELWDNTIVILMGDHGYHLGEHDWWNKVTLFENGTRSPMIIWVPEAGGMGKPTDSIMEFIDLYPTLVDYTGLEAPHKLSGISLRPVLEDPTAQTKLAAYTQVNRGERIGRTVRTARWRYTEWGKDGKYGIELYDHSKDRGEYYNVADNPEHAPLISFMKQGLDKGFGPYNGE